MHKIIKLSKLILPLLLVLGLFACTNKDEVLNGAFKEIKDNLNVNVSSDFSLPELSKSYKDVEVTWTSDKPEIIDNDGKFTRPIFDTEVKITITLEYKGKHIEKEITVTAVGMSEEERANLVLDSLLINEFVENDLTLPTKNEEYGALISWESSEPSLISNYGKVIQSKETKKVTLTATVTVGNVTKIKTFNVTIPKLKIVEVNITKPNKEIYQFGEELDLTGGLVEIIYEKGIKEEIPLDISMVTGYDKEKLGKQELTITYLENSITFNVEVNDAIDKIELVEPSKLIYLFGEELDLTGGLLKVTYLSGKYEEIALTLEMVSNYDQEKLGKQIVSITYQGKELEFEIEVLDDIASFDFIPPTKNRYFIGEELDLTGGVVKLIYLSGKEETVGITIEMVSGFNNQELGFQELTVTYNDQEFTFEIAIVEVEIELTIPEQTDYYFGESLNLGGGYFTLTNNLNEVEIVELHVNMVINYDPEKLGEQVVTLLFSGQEFYFTVHVHDKIASVEFKAPKKINYLNGEALDLSGGKFNLYYLSGKVEEIALTEDMISTYDATIPGEQTIYAYYEDQEFTFTVKFASEDAIKLPKPTGLGARVYGIVWGQNLDIEQASGFYIYIDDMEPIFIDLTFELNIIKLGLPVGDYTIRIQAVGDNINYLDSEISDAIKFTIPVTNGNHSLSGKAYSNSGSADLAVDNDLNSRWESEHGIDDVHFTIDFITPRYVQIIKIYWEAAHAKSYIIQISNDGENWTDIYVENNSSGGVETIVLDERIQTRFIRLQGIERATGYGYSIFEFEVYDEIYENLALNKDAYASSGDAKQVNDGNINSRWESAHTDDEHITIDLGEIYTINTVVLRWEAAYGKQYLIQISLDGENWTTVYTENDSFGNNDNIYFDAVEARYVRMQGIERALPYGYSIFEFAIYNLS